MIPTWVLILTLAGQPTTPVYIPFKAELACRQAIVLMRHEGVQIDKAWCFPVWVRT